MNQAVKFVKEAYIELKNCTWLSRKQMMLSTWAVIVLVIAFSIFFFLVDKALALAIGWILTGPIK